MCWQPHFTDQRTEAQRFTVLPAPHTYSLPQSWGRRQFLTDPRVHTLSNALSCFLHIFRFSNAEQLYPSEKYNLEPCAPHTGHLAALWSISLMLPVTSCWCCLTYCLPSHFHWVLLYPQWGCGVWPQISGLSSGLWLFPSSLQARLHLVPSWPGHGSATCTHLTTPHYQACGRWSPSVSGWLWSDCSPHSGS